MRQVIISSDGVPLRYEVHGSGEPALVFVPCWSWTEAIGNDN